MAFARLVGYLRCRRRVERLLLGRMHCEATARPRQHEQHEQRGTRTHALDEPFILLSSLASHFFVSSLEAGQNGRIDSSSSRWSCRLEWLSGTTAANYAQRAKKLQTASSSPSHDTFGAERASCPAADWRLATHLHAACILTSQLSPPSRRSLPESWLMQRRSEWTACVEDRLCKSLLILFRHLDSVLFNRK